MPRAALKWKISIHSGRQSVDTYWLITICHKREDKWSRQKNKLLGYRVLSGRHWDKRGTLSTLGGSEGFSEEVIYNALQRVKRLKYW
jgi:hypothetical protein